LQIPVPHEDTFPPVGVAKRYVPWESRGAQIAPSGQALVKPAPVVPLDKPERAGRNVTRR
ncbi:MAG: hypothetical protein WB684_10920, partial [Gaiella sp.]